jgi:hypothetical protein
VFSKQYSLPNDRIELDHGDLALRIDDILSRRVKEASAGCTHELDGDRLALATSHQCWDGGMHYCNDCRPSEWLLTDGLSDYNKLTRTNSMLYVATGNA